jgi:hypothetical protein
MRACGEFIRLFRSVGLTMESAAEAVRGDDAGLGHVVIDRLHELGWHIGRDNAGAAAERSDLYLNHGAETWSEAAIELEKGTWIVDADETLQAQMVSRKTKPRSDGRIQLESKEEMRKRGIGSPDRADAAFGAMRRPRAVKPIPFGGDGRDGTLMERLMEEAGLGTLAGARCE